MANSSKPRKERTDIYQLITDTLIQRMEQGFIPWKMPWALSGPAQNFVSRKPYRGLNSLLLNGLFESPYFLTLKQANDLGGKIIKGSKSLPVTFWSRRYYHAVTGKPLTEDQARALPNTMVQTSSFLKYYRVFNEKHVEGIEFPKPSRPETSTAQRVEKCEEMVRQMPMKPVIIHGGHQAYYLPLADTVNMPDIESFFDTEGYYHTLFHELGHATGHEKRLNRKGVAERTKFGDMDYSFEELVAELTASFVANAMGLHSEATVENTAAYLQCWIKVLQDDKTMIVRASGLAQKAADWIQNLVPEMA